MGKPLKSDWLMFICSANFLYKPCTVLLVLQCWNCFLLLKKTGQCLQLHSFPLLGIPRVLYIRVVRYYTSIGNNRCCTVPVKWLYCELRVPGAMYPINLFFFSQRPSGHYHLNRSNGAKVCEPTDSMVGNLVVEVMVWMDTGMWGCEATSI